MTEEEQQQYIESLWKRASQGGHSVYMRYYKDGKPTEIDRLFQLLSLHDGQLTEDGNKALNYLESQNEANEKYFTFEKFKWKVLAFLSIQDCFDMILHDEYNDRNIFQSKYFYYESKYVLIESILSGLNGLHIASKQLLRGFLEFNLLQNYFNNIIFKEHSFRVFNQYLKNKQTPNYNTILQNAIPQDEFCRPLKKRIQVELKNLSERFSHAYEPSMSPKSNGIFIPESSFDSLYFWVHTSVVLDIVIWLYCVNYPMLFHPVDTIRKFGFGGPVGSFITISNASIIQKVLSDDDYELFKGYSKDKQVVKDLMSFYNQQPDLTEEEIWKTLSVERKEDDTIDGCFVKQIVEMRAYHELLSVTAMKNEPPEKDVYSNFLKHYVEYSGWRKVYKNVP